MDPSKPSRALDPAALGVGVSAGVFVVDLLVPRGIAVGVLHVVAVAAVIGSRVRWHVVALAALATLLTLAAAVFDAPTRVPLSFVIANRALSVATIWLTAALVWLLRARTEREEIARAQTTEWIREKDMVHAVALAKVNTELERSNRELEQVAYGASHDLKAPLRGIATVCDWLEDDLADAMTVDVRKHFDQLRSRVRRMVAIVDGILAFARVGHAHAQPETVDIGALLRDTVDMLQVPAGATVEVPPGMPTANVQRRLLEQVFANLIGNAIKYARRADPRVTVGFTEKGHFVEFFVSDNGPGIASQHRDRIWTLFHRLVSQDDIEGTGVGLALVKKIVEGQGGRAWVESELGHGATFRFLWPSAPIEDDAPGVLDPGSTASAP